MKIFLYSIISFFLFSIVVHSQNNVSRIKLKSKFITEPPIIDGELNDKAWDRLADVDEYFTTYSPINGNILPAKTQVWISNDEENIYFAFYCHDSEADKIKGSITKHDNIWNDDWI